MSGNYTVTTYFPSYEASWAHCRKQFGGGEVPCLHQLETLKNNYLTKCNAAFDNAQVQCFSSLRTGVIKGFTPQLSTDAEVWQRCRTQAGRSKKHCTGELRNSHARFTDFCLRTAYLDEKECQSRLQRDQIRNFTPPP